MNQGFDVSYGLFDEEISKFEIKGGLTEVKKEFYHLDWYARSWKMWPAVDKVDVMYEPLWALHTIFSDIWPWGLIWTAHDTLRTKMDNAIYTFEQKLVQQLETEPSEDEKKELVAKMKALVLNDYRADGAKATQLYYHEILKTIVMPPFEKVVIPACKTIIDPISDLVPEPLKQFLDPSQMFEDLINGIVDECIDTVLNADEEKSEN